MSWIEPTFTCGICGGDIARWPMLNLLRQEIADWRHKTVGAGFGEHRAVLGTPAHRPVVSPPTKPQKLHDEIVVPDVAPLPVEPARPAKPHELPATAARFKKKAEENGWTVAAWYMHGPLMTSAWKFTQMVESVVLHADRDGVRLVAAWQSRVPGAPSWPAKDWPGTPYVESYNPWSFDLAYILGRTAEPLTSPELNREVRMPRMSCEDCGQPPALHHSTPGGLACHDEFLARQKEAA